MSMRATILLVLIAMRPAFGQQYEFTYTSETGNLFLDVPAELPGFTTLRLQSENNLFIGTVPDVLTGVFDVFQPHETVPAKSNGFFLRPILVPFFSRTFLLPS